MPNPHIICTLVQCSSAHTAPPTSSGNHPVSVINRRHLHGQTPPARADATCTGRRHLDGQKQPHADTHPEWKPPARAEAAPR